MVVNNRFEPVEAIDAIEVVVDEARKIEEKVFASNLKNDPLILVIILIQ